MKRTPYWELVGNLNYLAVATHPDIAFTVRRLAFFLNCYCDEHWNAALHVLRYLKGTHSLSLVLGGSFLLSLSGYSDADYANCHDTSRSISRYCFSLSLGVISWSSKKQKHTADLSCYAKYIALHHAGKKVIFLLSLLEGLGHMPVKKISLYCDNDTVRLLAKDHSHYANVKHIRVKYHTICNIVEEGLAVLTCISSSNNVADILTKPLARADFECLRLLLGLRFS